MLHILEALDVVKIMIKSESAKNNGKFVFMEELFLKRIIHKFYSY